MHYDQQYISTTTDNWASNVTSRNVWNANILQLPDTVPGLALEDDVLEHVKAAYEKIMGNDDNGFMMFEDREGAEGGLGVEEE